MLKNILRKDNELLAHIIKCERKEKITFVIEEVLTTLVFFGVVGCIFGFYFVF